MPSAEQNRALVASLDVRATSDLFAYICAYLRTFALKTCFLTNVVSQQSADAGRCLPCSLWLNLLAFFEDRNHRAIRISGTWVACHAECDRPQRRRHARRQPFPRPGAQLRPAAAARVSPPARRGSCAQPPPRQAPSPATSRGGVPGTPAALATLVQLARRRALRGHARNGKRGARQAKDHRESQANTSGHGRPPSVCDATLPRRASGRQLTRPPASHMFDRRAPPRSAAGGNRNG